MNLLGLALVWLGLAGGVFCKLIAFSTESAWFGLGLACGVLYKIIVLSNESARFGLGLVWFGWWCVL